MQETLIRGRPEDATREVHTLVGSFGSRGGRYVGGTSHSIMPETPVGNIIAMCEAFAECVSGRPWGMVHRCLDRRQARR